MTVCKITRNDAANRIKKMSENSWKVPVKAFTPEQKMDEVASEEEATLNLQEYIFDFISKYIIQKFKGHDMERLIEEILIAKGFTTYHSPKGADGGVDILASKGSLGFGGSKICVHG